MAASEVRLVEPAVEHEAEFRAMEAEFRDEGATAFGPYRTAADDFRAFVGNLADEARGESLPPGWVPQRTYWLVRGDGRMLGHCRLRLRLTPALEDFGGHIGYAVRPSERRKGYGTRLLALTLDKAREAGLRRVLLTCDPDNTTSARVIERNGGVLASRTWSPRAERMTSRYWIELYGPEQCSDQISNQ